jgi:hypothetical protein
VEREKEREGKFFPLGESKSFLDPCSIPSSDTKEVSNTGPFDLVLSDVSGVNKQQREKETNGSRHPFS